jgi:hypothetical protein
MFGLLGAALLYGDGAITPAISVLSAVEGLKVDAPTLAPAIVPITIVVLIVLFLAQRRGTGFIGKIFGPIMLVWFVVIGGLLVGFVAGRGLLDFFEAQQQLILRKRLGPSAEPMTLHLLDDLGEPFGARALRQQHCLQRRGIVRERIGRVRHGPIRSCATPRRDHMHQTDSLCRNHPGCIGAGVSRTT